jgi:Rho guanine nucleotide exchange factor 7
VTAVITGIEMNEVGSRPLHVKAIYNFQPANTDELSFQKGDVITVTQVIDGGWWEGTLHGITGWFPSNYVRDMKVDGARSPTGKSSDAKISKQDSQIGATTNNHLVVLQELIANEKKYASLVDELLNTYLHPLQDNGMLNHAEYADITSNLADIASLHNDMLLHFEDAFKLPVAQQRFGGIFLDLASKVQDLYYKYSASHPKAVAVLQLKRDELNKYMEGLGAASPGVMTLTTRLSKPFQQIERYSRLLKELERHSEESHADRGDTQRAIAIYRDIAVTCSEIRRQKEMEYDIIHTEIRGWEGEEMSVLGEILMLSHVRIQMENGERRERLMLLFPGVLIFLSVTARVSGYVYEGKMSVSNASVNNCDDIDKNAFEISGGVGIDRVIVVCSSLQEKSKWVNMLKQYARTVLASVLTKPQNLQVSVSYSPPSLVVSTKPCETTHVVNSTTYSKAAPINLISSKWNMSCLRPCAPLRPSIFVKDDGTRSPRAGRRLLGTGRRKLVDDAKVLEEDALILRLIEAYCTSAKVRQTVNSSLLENPQVLIAEEEKIIVEEVKDNQIVVEEKTLVDTVYSLKDQVRELRQEQQRLRCDLDNEKRARKHLEGRLRHSLKSIVENTGELHDVATAIVNL